MFYLTCSSCRHLSMGNKHKNFEVIDAHLPRGKAQRRHGSGSGGVEGAKRLLITIGCVGNCGQMTVG